MVVISIEKDKSPHLLSISLVYQHRGIATVLKAALENGGDFLHQEKAKRQTRAECDDRHQRFNDLTGIVKDGSDVNRERQSLTPFL